MKPLTLRQKVERDIKNRARRKRPKPKMVRFVYMGIKELEEAFNEEGLECNPSDLLPDFKTTLSVFRGSTSYPPQINYMGLRVHFFDTESYFNTK